MSEELVVRENETALAQRFLPVLSLEQSLARRDVVVQATKQLMREGVDFGSIPGIERQTLLQPGADKLCNLFGLTIKYSFDQKIEDWTGADHGGEPFFYYLIRSQAFRGEWLAGEGVGSCNSWEAKYRWRKGDRTCPKCGAAAIIAGRKEYGGSWLCYAKKGGCGAKFADDDPSITSQTVGRVPNQDVYDVINTVQKMAFKRAKISATINATSASEFFTQDVEDLPELHAPGEKPPSPQGVAQKRIDELKAKQSAPAPASPVPSDVPWKSYKGMIEAFGKLKAELGPYENIYRAALNRARPHLFDEHGEQWKGVEHCNQFPKTKLGGAAALECYRELQQAVKQYQAMTALEVSEADIPEFSPEAEK